MCVLRLARLPAASLSPAGRVRCWVLAWCIALVLHVGIDACSGRYWMPGDVCLGMLGTYTGAYLGGLQLGPMHGRAVLRR